MPVEAPQGRLKVSADPERLVVESADATTEGSRLLLQNLVDVRLGLTSDGARLPHPSVQSPRSRATSTRRRARPPSKRSAEGLRVRSPPAQLRAQVGSSPTAESSSAVGAAPAESSSSGHSSGLRSIRDEVDGQRRDPAPVHDDEAALDEPGFRSTGPIVLSRLRWTPATKANVPHGRRGM